MGAELDSALALLNGYREPRNVGGSPFRLRCELSDRASPDLITDAWPDPIPQALTEFWLLHASARLFEDVDFGQWGLHVYSPVAAASATDVARRARPFDHEAGYIVIGEFLGDLEYLVLETEGSRTVSVRVALPLDERATWYTAAIDFPDFLLRYALAEGDKFWEA
jgi:hypothetical protein